MRWSLYFNFSNIRLWKLFNWSNSTKPLENFYAVWFVILFNDENQNGFVILFKKWKLADMIKFEIVIRHHFKQYKFLQNILRCRSNPVKLNIKFIHLWNNDNIEFNI